MNTATFVETTMQNLRHSVQKRSSPDGCTSEDLLTLNALAPLGKGGMGEVGKARDVTDLIAAAIAKDPNFSVLPANLSLARTPSPQESPAACRPVRSPACFH